MSTPSFSPEERRTRLWRRHHLARPLSGPDAAAAVTRDLVALHATDPASVFLGLRARTDDLGVGDVERALYEERSIARILAMRRTMFVTSIDRIPVLHAAASWSLARTERRRNLRLLEMADVEDPEAWHDRVADRTLSAVRELGAATAVELTEAVPELGLQVEVNRGKKWAGKIGMSSRVLLWLAIVGRVSRTEPLGSWKSTMYRWAPTREWLGLQLDARPEDPAGARADLARAYLRAFGPATFEDLHWWSGWNKTQTRKALEIVRPAEVELEDEPGFALPDDLADAADVADAAGRCDSDPRRVALLPPLDTTAMGWKRRDWYLGDLEEHLFDRNGNAGPTVWSDGRIVGGWAQRDDGEVVVRLLVDAGAEVADAADREAERLGEWLGEHVVVPRFRTPLERELSR
ncbi:MAG: winged helix DNA-binding domain-containing protein [Gemmatimonadales bacterium]